MALLWFLVWLVLPNRALLSGLDHCDIHETNSLHNMSPWLQSLQCYNDYSSHVDCKWKPPTNMTIQVWFKKDIEDNSSELCVPFEAENATEDGVVHCRFKTFVFAIGTRHTVFFMNNQTASLCSPSQHTAQDLVQHMRARPPGNLSVSEQNDGSQMLQWSSPYPPSSSLNKNLTFQLSFRHQAEDTWTIKTVATTRMTIKRQWLLPGHRYEAKVRTKASLGRWSEWSPVVIWKTRDESGQLPSLHCVLDGEKEVMCSWEVSRELAYLIAYQLTCRHTQTAQYERCCLNPAVRSTRGTEMRYSCLLTNVDPETLQLKLLLTHNAKTFAAHKYIRSKPPEQVKVRETNGDWDVEWSAPSTAPSELFYQVSYYRTKDQGSSLLLNSSKGSTCVTILGTSLIPLQDYEVKVRSLVVPGSGSTYEGIPSEWSDPAKWTSNKATWSVLKLIYLFSALIAAAAFLTLYHTIPACQKKVVLWVDSVPSPSKSKTLSEIKSSPSPFFMQSEKTSICNVQQFDSISTWSSDTLLWPTKGTEKSCADQNWKCRNCDKLPSTTDSVNGLDTSAISFSGPYIFCQESGAMSAKVQQKELNKTSSDGATPLFVAPCPLNDKDYVCLPSHTLSRSTEDLTSHSNSGPKWYDSPEQDQHHPHTTLRPIQSESRSSFGEPTMKNQPSEYTSGPLPSWPQEGSRSGYCQLPSALMAASK
ncbi:cytokine receptor common subunit beta-like [Girardinichthys multiradiatus]|uniref:cytokine receptor common subunit beta-like n=1 Tax=Girardinichthys multiradiatus TaxID=208333 RepID=UPI001FACD9EE|nr:cytokine receptor common subunit beta-like [Girardinichthys multiradiatus]